MRLLCSFPQLILHVRKCKLLPTLQFLCIHEPRIHSAIIHHEGHHHVLIESTHSTHPSEASRIRIQVEILLDNLLIFKIKSAWTSQASDKVPGRDHFDLIHLILEVLSLCEQMAYQASICFVQVDKLVLVLLLHKPVAYYGIKVIYLEEEAFLAKFVQECFWGLRGAAYCAATLVV